ncbi:MAG: hypothetical protein AB1400_03345 [Pseudomonadota bacterium]
MLLIDAIIAVAVFAAIGIIGSLFRRKKSPPPVAAHAPSRAASNELTLEHDMSFEYVITGESQHQAEIGTLLSEGKTPAYFTAELVPEGKQFGVHIQHTPVGQLITEDAVEFREWLTDNDLEGQSLTCRAVVQSGKDGYHVRLDLPLENV